MARRYEKKKPYAGLYRTAQWERLRSTVLTNDPWCVFCAKSGLKVPADVVDHIKPHKGDLDLFFSFDNLQGLCKSHHDGHKQRMERGQVVIQYGPNGFPLPIGG